MKAGEGGLLGRLTFKVANDRERAGALSLRRMVFEQDLRHLPRDEVDQCADQLVAIAGEEIIGAFRLVRPEYRPFDFESQLSVDAFLGEDRRPALVGRLCVRHDYRVVTRSTFVQAGMLTLAYLFACKHRITDLLLYTYPNLLQFYRGASFEDLHLTFEHPDWGSVCMMRMDISRFTERYADPSSSFGRLLSKNAAQFEV